MSVFLSLVILGTHNRHGRHSQERSLKLALTPQTKTIKLESVINLCIDDKEINGVTFPSFICDTENICCCVSYISIATTKITNSNSIRKEIIIWITYFEASKHISMEIMVQQSI